MLAETQRLYRSCNYKKEKEKYKTLLSELNILYEASGAEYLYWVNFIV